MCHECDTDKRSIASTTNSLGKLSHRDFFLEDEDDIYNENLKIFPQKKQKIM